MILKKRNKQLRNKLDIKPKTTEPPKIPTITEIESSRMIGYMDFDVGILNRNDPQLYLLKTKSLTSNFLLDKRSQIHGIKVNISFDIPFMKQDGKEQDGYSKTKSMEINNENNIAEVISDSNNELLNSISYWISKGSGWIIKFVNKHGLSAIRYVPFRGSSYLPLPNILKN